MKISDTHALDDTRQHDVCGRSALWIGNRTSPEFRTAYQICESGASQIAYRETLSAAVDRNATDVGTIVLASSDRTPVNRVALKQLADRHPSADRYRLLGSMCEGMTRGYQDFFRDRELNWLDGTSELASRFVSYSISAPSRAVAIVTSTFAAAEPLMEIAQHAGVAAVWTRQPNSSLIRGIDTVWWDDSIAGSTDLDGWESRLEMFGPSALRHVWLTNRTDWAQIDVACRAGISRVVTKPYRIEMLEASLGHQVSCVTPQMITRAA